MSSASPRRTTRPACRPDGWTPERQARFLAALAATRSVTDAARAVSMSRESAYRLRARDRRGLFAYLWDQALTPAPTGPREGHSRPLTDGQLLRSLGNHFRRESGEFARFASADADARNG